MQEYLQEPGGWNRVILQVSDVPVHIEAPKKLVYIFGMRWR
jgi:glutathione synthase/RimK-type ligase-like ATP-grasp enzyme